MKLKMDLNATSVDNEVSEKTKTVEVKTNAGELRRKSTSCDNISNTDQRKKKEHLQSCTKPAILFDDHFSLQHESRSPIIHFPFQRETEPFSYTKGEKCENIKDLSSFGGPGNGALDLKITASIDGERKVELSPNILQISSNSDLSKCSSDHSVNKFSSEDTSSLCETSRDSNSRESSDERETSYDDFPHSCENKLSDRFYVEKYKKKKSCLSKPTRSCKSNSRTIRESNPSAKESIELMVMRKKGMGRGLLKKIIDDSSSNLDEKIHLDEIGFQSEKQNCDQYDPITTENMKSMKGFGRGLLKKMFSDNHYGQFSDTNTNARVTDEQSKEKHSLTETTSTLNEQIIKNEQLPAGSVRGFGRGIIKQVDNENPAGPTRSTDIKVPLDKHCEYLGQNRTTDEPSIDVHPVLSTESQNANTLYSNFPKQLLNCSKTVFPYSLEKGNDFQQDSLEEYVPHKSKEVVSQFRLEQSTEREIKIPVEKEKVMMLEKQFECTTLSTETNIPDVSPISITVNKDRVNSSEECSTLKLEQNVLNQRTFVDEIINPSICPADSSNCPSFSQTNLPSSKGFLARLFCKVVHREMEETSPSANNELTVTSPVSCIKTEIKSQKYNQEKNVLLNEMSNDEVFVQEENEGNQSTISSILVEKLGSINKGLKFKDSKELDNTIFDSSTSTASEELSLANKFIEDESTSMSEFNRDSEEESRNRRRSQRKKTDDHSDDEALLKFHTSGSIIHGDVQVTLVSKVQELKIQDLIMRNLEYKRITDLTRSQMVTIPIVSEQRNLILIGPPGTKKTSGWLIPMLNNLLLGNDKLAENTSRNSPRCIILCEGSTRVRYLARLCSSYVGAKLITIATYGGGLELERKDELLTGVDILISTPRCCLRLFEYNFIINPDRLRYLVIDTAHDVLHKFPKEIDLLKKGVEYLYKIREIFNEDSRIQIVATGTTWTNEIENFALHWLKNPVICLTSYLEAAVYSRIEFKLNIMRNVEKITNLLEKISNNNIRTVIVCCNADEVKHLRSKLTTLQGRTVLAAHEEIHHTLIPDLREAWSTSENVPLLICSDFILSEIDVSNVKWLIHYSLPVSKPVFRDRFKFIKDSFIDRVKNKSDERSNCTVDIFIDENTEGHLPKIVELLKRLNISISDELNVKVQEIERNKELEKCEITFCENILQFGNCWKHNCRMRHIIIPTKDAPQLKPAVTNFVTLHITEVMSPTHLIGRIKSYSPKLFSSEETTLQSKFLTISLQLAELFMDKSNRYIHGHPSVGDVVAIAFKEDEFVRGKIIEIIERDNRCIATEVNLYLIDKGTYLKKNTADLLSLPTNLQILPGEAVNVFLTGLLPLDLDQCWSYTVNKCVKQKIMQFQNDEHRDITIVAQVALVIGKNLLVDKILFYEKPSEDSSPWVLESLRLFITSSNFGLENRSYTKILNNLAEGIGISLTNQAEEMDLIRKNALKREEECRWANLNSLEVCYVNVIIAEDLDTIFVRNTKFQKCLNLLEQDLTSAIKKDASHLREFDFGTFCAVLSENDKYNRGMILDPLEPDNLIDDTEVEVFFVDYGERVIFQKSHVYKLPKGFISRLPFQAIECGLAGIKPILNKSDEAVQCLYDLTSSDNNWNPLYVKAIESNSAANLTGGSHYEIILLDTSNEQDILINEEMINRGYAQWQDDMKEQILTSKEDSKIERGLPALADNSKEPDIGDNNWKFDNDVIKKCPSIDIQNDAIVSYEGQSSVDFNEFEIVGNFVETTLPFLFPKGVLDDIINNENISLDPIKKSSVEIKDVAESDEDEKDEGSIISDEINDITEGDVGINNLCCLRQICVNSPTVHWRQSAYYLWIKILIPDIQIFKMEWTMSNLCLLTMNGDKLYWIDIELFGPINPDTVMHKLTGLYFEIKLTKLLTGHFWPRLFLSNKRLRGVIHDPEKLTLNEDSYDQVEKGFIPTYVARSEAESQKEKLIQNNRIINKFQKKKIHYSLDDSSTDESDIDDFHPIPDADDNITFEY